MKIPAIMDTIVSPFQVTACGFRRGILGGKLVSYRRRFPLCGKQTFTSFHRGKKKSGAFFSGFEQVNKKSRNIIFKGSKEGKLSI